MATIDDLPEVLLLHILSFLPILDAISTNSISSKWRSLWLSSPTLNLSINCITSLFNPFRPSSENPHLFAKFITRVLHLRICNPSGPSPIHKFRLSFNYHDDDLLKQHVDWWIQCATSWKCKVLFLQLNKDFDTCPYPFDFSSLLHSSVEFLELRGCNFSIPSTSITSLKSLYLENYHYIKDVSMLYELVRLCVNLEFLSIGECEGWQSFKISSMSLKELIISFHSGYGANQSYLDICAPNLRKLSLSAFFVGKFILRGVTSLVEASVLFSLKDTMFFHWWSHIIASLTDVERLTVENMWDLYKFDEIDKQGTNDHVRGNNSDSENDTQSTNEFYRKVSVSSEEMLSENSAFNKLKYLKLLTSYQKREVLGLELCLKMCPKLETLVLENVFMIDDDDDLIEMARSMPIIMHIPNLRQVELLKYKGTRNEEYVVELLKKQNAVLETITAFHAKENDFLGKTIILWSSSSSSSFVQ